MAILDLNEKIKRGVWGRCFQCNKKLESIEERKYGYCKGCLATMGVDLELA